MIHSQKPITHSAIKATFKSPVDKSHATPKKNIMQIRSTVVMSFAFYTSGVRRSLKRNDSSKRNRSTVQGRVHGASELHKFDQNDGLFV